MDAASKHGDLLAAVEQFDVETYLSGFGFVSLSDTEWVGACPRCGKDRKLAVNVVKKTFHCWVCQEYETVWDDRRGVHRRPVAGAGGLVALVAWMEGVGSPEAAERVLSAGAVNLDADLPGIGRVPDPPPVTVEVRPIPFPEGARSIESPLPYMLRRGLSMEDVRDYGLFWCAEGRYRDRLVFPVWEDGCLVYWQARAMYEQGDLSGGRFVKALNPPRVDGAAGSADVLMNLDVARHYPRVALVEGPIDAIRTGRDAVCTFGKRIHSRQLVRLVRSGVRAVDLMWDGPTDGEPDGAWPEMISAAASLVVHFDTRLVFLPHGDPGDWDRASLDTFRRCATPAEDVLGGGL